ncbi:MAG: Cellulase (glycosyl hydrolase family 5) [Spirochaetes bacterium ADurb.Bin110]|nr:MAG: Cellulase (glycosyl hydrolase family 5) [Spirochaetes bacterium ADurb.Bin110]
MSIISVSNGHFIDDKGRWLILRGVNLGGSNKVPMVPDGRTHLKDGFYSSTKISFIGRPFALEKADEHFSRLASWGQKFLRLVVTWEAIEHEGPGIYDTEYLDYLEGIVEAAARHGISLFIDPHQDVWSRWTGGDGAPMWTLEAVGFEPSKLHESGAAMLHQEMGAQYPEMQWFSNHLRLGCATMFTLFFAGNDYAPGVFAKGRPIQEYLQEHYFEAFGVLAKRIAPYDNVLGFGSMNEPGEGFIGISDVNAPRSDMLLPGLAPTPWEAMCAGEGFETSTNRIAIKGGKLRSFERVPLGTKGVRAWKQGEVCVWRRAGLWDIENDRPVLKQPSWFAPKGTCSAKTRERKNKTVPNTHSFFNECYQKPFVERFAEHLAHVSGKSSRFMVFVEGFPQGDMPALQPSFLYVNESHWYDSLTLTMKRWTGFLAYDSEMQKVIIGSHAVRRYFREALGRIVRHSKKFMGNAPTLLGEFGLPFDLNNRKAYQTGNFELHEKILSLYYDALDANLLSATLWNYTADNTHEHGDGWNREDLSVFCKEDGGGRALAGFVRPYAPAVAGDILLMQFNRRKGRFILEYKPDHSIKAPSEVFVPMIQFPRGALISAWGATFSEPDYRIVKGTKKASLPAGALAGSSQYLMLKIDAEPSANLCRVLISRL